MTAPRPSLLVLPLVAGSLLLAACASGSRRAAPSSTVATTTVTPSTVTTVPADPVAATRALFAPVAPDMPGCTVAVARDGEVVFAEAYGAARLDPRRPMTTDTVVDIGSTSKQFTATAVLLLVDRGLVQLDEPLATYLPTLPAWAARTTVRQALHHQTGIPDYIELLVAGGIATTTRATDADALAALGRVSALEFEPGTQWAYSNSNYFLLGQVVLARSGRDLGTFLADEVFRPLGLAMVMAPAVPIPGKAVSYTGEGAARTVADSPWEQLGDGGVQTTPSQLVRWASQYWAPTIGGTGIAAARFDRAADVPELGGRYGAGIFEREVPGVGRVLTHSGGWGGFVTAFAVVPGRRLAVAATCAAGETAAALGVTGDLDVLRPWVEA